MKKTMGIWHRRVTVEIAEVDEDVAITEGARWNRGIRPGSDQHVM